jgi:AraC family transcriptional regulator
MDIALVDIPERPVAAILHVGPYPLIGAAFDRLGDWAQRNAGVITGPPMALYPDDSQTTPPDELRSFAALPIAPQASIDPAGTVERITVAGGRYAVAAHHGTYAGLANAWQEFMAAVAADGLNPDWSRSCFEVYANEPGTVPEEELVTEMYQPIS